MVMERKGHQSARSVHHLVTVVIVVTEGVTAEAAAEIVVVAVEIVVAVAVETVAGVAVVIADREDKKKGSVMGAFFLARGRGLRAEGRGQRDCQE